MIERFQKLPQSLEQHARKIPLRAPDQDIPALLVHPDWISPRPTLLWLHGRTAHKELDSGRYQRLLKLGIASCAIDLPGHGERFDRALQSPASTLLVLQQALREIDSVIEALADPIFQGVFDLDRLALGGMSAGGMATLRRLCNDHPFSCAAVEACTGFLSDLYAQGGPWNVHHDPNLIAALDPLSHLSPAFKPIPLLVLHAEHDQTVPIALQQHFLDRLRDLYRTLDADPSLIRLHTFPHTGAPQEHSGFGKFGNDAKNLQAEFLARHLLP